MVSLDGYFVGPNGDLTWHNFDDELQELAEQNATSGNTLLFGRVTYEMMRNYWTSTDALDNDPIVARGMNDAEKVVFSRTLQAVDWANTRLAKGDLVKEVRAMKTQPGSDLTILGSGTIVAQLAPAGLIDTYQVLLNPVVLGAGRTMFEGSGERFMLNLVATRAFKNGNLLLEYASTA